MGKGNSDLFGDILKRVSRTFYLSLNVLPRDVRRPVGLAYLFARAADTIADTRLISREKRLEYLELFRSEVRENESNRIREVTEALTGPQKIPEERELLARLEECFAVYRALDPADRERIRDLILTITQGMQMDLTMFPGEEEGQLVALKTRDDLDSYTYYVAGCVGEFWTEMHMAHHPSLKDWDVAEMKKRGVRFGKGLQMTNILRDLSKDLRLGRCYLPQEDLETLGLAPSDLLDRQAIDRVRPLLHSLLEVTLAHYREGWNYTLAIPRQEVRMRLACAWPLLIGLKTLALVAQSKNLLDPVATVKISRGEVYRLLLRSLTLIGSDRSLTGYYQALRARIALG
ncbi:MAG: phytoene/squalene synthase family protein [candidate division NC10 bacterium]|nr:phytoene/squalene synthase family protein [candidate division NC10 bacterium]